MESLNREILLIQKELYELEISWNLNVDENKAKLKTVNKLLENDVMNTTATANNTVTTNPGYINPAFVVSTVSKYKLYKQLGVKQKVSRLNPLNHTDMLPHDTHIVAVRKVTPTILNEIVDYDNKFHAKERLELGVYLIEYVTSELEACELVEKAKRDVTLEDNRLHEIERLSSETIRINREYRAGYLDIDEVKSYYAAMDKVVDAMINIKAPTNIFKIAIDLRADMHVEIAVYENSKKKGL